MKRCKDLSEEGREDLKKQKKAENERKDAEALTKEMTTLPAGRVARYATCCSNLVRASTYSRSMSSMGLGDGVPSSMPW